MATSLAPHSVARPFEGRESPGPAALWSIALAGAAAAATSVVLVLTSDHVSEPGVRAVLTVWVMLPYVLAGVVAWWRRPESHFGPLLVAAGFAFFVSSLSTASGSVAYTIGISFDLLPAVLFLPSSSPSRQAASSRDSSAVSSREGTSWRSASNWSAWRSAVSAPMTCSS